MAVAVAGKRVGQATVAFERPPALVGAASVVGPREGRGPLGREFDVVKDDDLLGEASWEKAEARMLVEACRTALRKANLQAHDVDYLLAGDLLNQLVSASCAARDLSLPYLGLFGACATIVEALALAAMLIDGGFARFVLAASSSHHNAAERQFRFPTEFATQRPPTAQWTVTAAAAIVVAAEGAGPVLTHATVGRVVDMGAQDVNDMGAAMAPAAADTVWQHLRDLGRQPRDCGLILSGDLGHHGARLARELLGRTGVDIGSAYADCGALVFGAEQDAHAGGSGSGCAAAVFASHVLPRLQRGELDAALVVGTGALFSPTVVQQGETIPCVAHAVAVRGPGAYGAGPGVGPERGDARA